MGIKLKFLFKNIWEKKIRTLLIIFAVTIATALAFSSFGISDTFKNIVEDKYKISFGNAEIFVSPKGEENSLINLDSIENDGVDNKLGILNLSGVYKQESEDLAVNILAVSDMKELAAINPIYLTNDNEEINIHNLKDNEVIISSKLAEKLAVKNNDEFEIQLNKRNVRLKVGAISAPKGFLSEKPGVITVIGNSKWFGKESGIENQYSQVLIKVKNSYTIDEVKENLKSEISGYYIDKCIDDDLLSEAVNQYMIPFYIMLALVLLMSSFIIYSSFKVIALERLSTIGTFRSIGSTKISTDFLLILEAILYGFIGGIIGIVVGVPALYYLSDNSNQYKDLGVETIVDINPKYILLAIILALILVIISALIPIIETSKISVKDVILGTYNKSEELGVLNLIIAIVMLISSYIYISKFRNTGNLILSLLTAFMVIIGTGLILPYIMRFLGLIFTGILRAIFGNEGALALNNIATSKVLANNVILLTIGLAVVIIVNAATYSVGKMNEDIYKYLDYKVVVDNIGSRSWSNIKDEMANLDGVNGYYENYYERNIDVEDAKYNIGLLSGVDIKKFEDYYKEVKFFNDNERINSEEVLKRLDDGKNIIISDLIQSKYKVKIGDKIKIKVKDKYVEYNVIGFISSYYSKINKSCLISQKNFKDDLQQYYPNSILVNGQEDEGILSKRIKNKLLPYNVEVKNISEEKEATINENASIMSILEGFSFIALLIGGLGIANNLLVSFMQRKKEMAVLASVGMSKVQRSKMIIIEGALIAIIGTSMGIFLSYMLMKFVPEIIISLDAYLNIEIPQNETAVLILVSCLLVIISSIIPILKSSKIAIIKEIKYE